MISFNSYGFGMRSHVRNVLCCGALALAALFTFSTSPVHGAPQEAARIAVDGRLTDGSGAPVSAAVSIVVRLYASSSGGSALYSESFSVTPQAGAYSLTLGSTGDPSPLLRSMSQLWFSLEVNGDGEMEPRTGLGASAFAVNANALQGSRYPKAPNNGSNEPMDPSGALGAPTAGDLWFDETAGVLKVFNGAAWQPTASGGSGGGDFFADGSVAMSGALNLNENNIMGAGNISAFGSVSAAGFSGDGAGLMNVDAEMLGGNPASYYSDAANLTGTLPPGLLAGITIDAANVASGTLADGRLPLNVTRAGNAFNAPESLVQLDASGRLPMVDGSQLTGIVAASALSAGSATTASTAENATNFGGNAPAFYLDAGNLNTGVLADGRLSANVTLAGNNFNTPDGLVRLDMSGQLPNGLLAGISVDAANVTGVLDLSKLNGASANDNDILKYNASLGSWAPAPPASGSEVDPRLPSGSASGELLTWDDMNGNWVSGPATFLPTAGGAMTGQLDMGGQNIVGVAALTASGTVNAGSVSAGSVSASGTVSANGFSGDGSGLTGVSAASAANATTLGGNSPAFYTDAANLTGILPAGVFPSVLPALDGSTLTGVVAVNSTQLDGQPAAFYSDAANLTGTLNDLRLSFNVTLAGNTFNGPNQLVQLDSGGMLSATLLTGALPALNGSALTGVNSTQLNGQPAAFYTSAANLTGPLPALDGAALTGVIAVNSTQLNGQPAAFYSDAANLTGTLNDLRLSSNVTLAGNTFNGPNQLVQLDSGGMLSATLLTGALPALNGSALTGVNATQLNGQAAAFYTSAANLTGPLPALDGSALTAVNAATLGGNASTFYQNASNINAGSLSLARLDTTGATTGNILRLAGGVWSPEPLAVLPGQILGGSATTGDILQYNGTLWGPTALSVAPNQIVGGGATTNQVLTWNGTAWIPATPSGGGSLPNGTATGQVPTWDGSAWIAGGPVLMTAPLDMSNSLIKGVNPGNAATPGLSFQGGLNTGVFHELGHLGFTTEGAERMRVNSNGVVVMNAAAPPSGQNGAIYYDTTNGKFRVFENSAWMDMISPPTFPLLASPGGNATNPAYSFAGAAGFFNTGMFLPNPGTLAFSTQGFEAMHLVFDGFDKANVGIGTNDPQTNRLRVVGDSPIAMLSENMATGGPAVAVEGKALGTGSGERIGGKFVANNGSNNLGVIGLGGVSTLPAITSGFGGYFSHESPTGNSIGVFGKTKGLEPTAKNYGVVGISSEFVDEPETPGRVGVYGFTDYEAVNSSNSGLGGYFVSKVPSGTRSVGLVGRADSPGGAGVVPERYGVVGLARLNPAPPLFPLAAPGIYAVYGEADMEGASAVYGTTSAGGSGSTIVNVGVRGRANGGPDSGAMNIGVRGQADGAVAANAMNVGVQGWGVANPAEWQYGVVGLQGPLPSAPNVKPTVQTKAGVYGESADNNGVGVFAFNGATPGGPSNPAMALKVEVANAGTDPMASFRVSGTPMLDITRDGTILASIGTPTNPAYGFQAGTPAGMYRVSEDLAFANNGQPKLIIKGGAAGDVIPGTDASQSLGVSTAKWTEVWAVAGALNTSDRREKKEIENSDLGLDFLMKLRPASYRWKNERIEGKFYGFIAQEVEEVLAGHEFAGLVYDKKSDSYAMRYTEMIAPLVKAVQEQQAEIERLRGEIDLLKNKN